MFKVLAVAVLATLSLCAADLTGKWKGDAKRPDGAVQSIILLDLKQEGSAVSGRVGRGETEESAAIENAKLENGKLTFEVSAGSSLYRVSLTAEGDSLKGAIIRSRDGEDSPPMAVELTRQK